MDHLCFQLTDVTLTFPLERYGYRLTRTLNNKNRWHTKLVCNISDALSRNLVATTYKNKNDYLAFTKVVDLLGANAKLSPRPVKFFPEHNTAICDYIGIFLFEFLLENPACLEESLISVFSYLEDINSLSRAQRAFIIPPIVELAFQLPQEFADRFIFLPKVKASLAKLKESNTKFKYGYGFQDPHIWNFRVVQSEDGIKALTTDFDYFSNQINYFWELGYFYATFRWIKKKHFSLGTEAELILLSLVSSQDNKSKFMFWLGALSSYCGYRDSLLGLSIGRGNSLGELKQEQKMIRFLDQKVAYLAQKILDN